MGSIARQLGLTRRRTPVPAKPYDHLTKAELWARVQALEGAVDRAAVLAARHARDAHDAHAPAERDRFHEVRGPLDLVRGR